MAGSKSQICLVNIPKQGGTSALHRVGWSVLPLLATDHCSLGSVRILGCLILENSVHWPSHFPPLCTEVLESQLASVVFPTVSPALCIGLPPSGTQTPCCWMDGVWVEEGSDAQGCTGVPGRAGMSFWALYGNRKGWGVELNGGPANQPFQVRSELDTCFWGLLVFVLVHISDLYSVFLSFYRMTSSL